VGDWHRLGCCRGVHDDGGRGWRQCRGAIARHAVEGARRRGLAPAWRP
jgi:hypothetical protein